MSHESGTLRTRILPAAAACMALLGSAPLGAQQPKAAPANGPAREHVVRKGDTLWDLARQYLNDPFLWPAIYQANRSVVRNPDLIYPAERLVIPPAGPVMAADATRAAPAPAAAAPAEAAPAQAVPMGVAAAPEARTVFYDSGQGAAGMDTVASLERPLVPETEFQSAAWVAEPEALPVVARLLREVDPSTGQDRLTQSLHPQESVFLGFEGGQRLEVGQRLQLEEVGREISGSGRIIQPVAILRVDSVGAGVAVATVARQFGTVIRGQRALALPAYPGAAARAEPVQSGPRGTVLGFLEEQPLYGTMDVAFVSLGRAQGLALGDQLEAYEPSEPSPGAESRTLPPVALARFTVVRVGERVSTVRVTSVTHAGLRSGVPVQLVAKAP